MCAVSTSQIAGILHFNDNDLSSIVLVSLMYFEQISHIVPMFPLMTSNN